MLEPAPIVGVSKTTYVLATPRRLDWRRGLQQTSTSNAPSDSDSQDPCRRPATRHRGDRRSPRPPVARVLVLDAVLHGVLVLDGPCRRRCPRRSTAASPIGDPSQRAPSIFAASTAVRLARMTVPYPTARRSSMTAIPGVANLDPALLGALRQAATHAAYDGVEFFVDSGWRSAEYQEATAPAGDPEVRLKRGSCSMGGHPQHVCSRVGGSGRHWALRCRSVAVRARRQVRAVPDLPQRILALRTSPRSHRSRLPAHVRRPYARPKDAAVTNNAWKDLAPMCARACAWLPARPSSRPAPRTGRSICSRRRDHPDALRIGRTP